MFKLLSMLQKNLVWSIPISMALGLAFGYFFDASPLKQFIIPVTFVMVYPMMVTLNLKTVFKGGDSKLQITTQVINFVIIPAVALGVGSLFFSGAQEKYGLWAVGLFLIGVLPTSGMTISWTGFARGNKEAAIKMVVFGLFIGALAAPIYTKLFMGAKVNVDMLHMFRQIALFVFVPMAAGIATQSWGRKRYGARNWNDVVKPKFPPFFRPGRGIDRIFGHVAQGQEHHRQPRRPDQHPDPPYGLLCGHLCAALHCGRQVLQAAGCGGNGLWGW